VTSWYAYDQRFHGGLKQQAEADLQAYPTVEQMKQTSGKYSEIELIKSDNGENENDRGAEHGVKLNSREWDKIVHELAPCLGDGGNGSMRTGVLNRAVAAGVLATPRLNEGGLPAKAASITQIKTGVVSPLQEDETSYYATAVIRKSQGRLKLARVTWLKEPVESWLARAEDQPPSTMIAAAASYTLPQISDTTGGCIEDTWTATPGPPDGRQNHTAVWTGSEMMVWGGAAIDGGVLRTGGRYNPAQTLG